MKNAKRLISLLLAVMCLMGAVTIPASAAAKNPWDYSTTPTRALYYKSPVMTGNDVKWLQQALNITVNAGLKVDGSFGPATKKAVQTFQKKQKLSVDGSFGPASRAKMVTLLTKKGYTIKKNNFLQTKTTDWSWQQYYTYGRNVKISIPGSACGILSMVNAVYNATGQFIDPMTVADWAYQNKYWNNNGIIDRNVFSAIAKKYGNTYGFQCLSTANGHSFVKEQSKLISHLKSGGTAVVHVDNHFMSIVGYNSANGKFLVYDPAPGGRRGNKTTAGGNWKTYKQLRAGDNIQVDTYWLFKSK